MQQDQGIKESLKKKKDLQRRLWFVFFGNGLHDWWYEDLTATSWTVMCTSNLSCESEDVVEDFLLPSTSSAECFNVLIFETVNSIPPPHDCVWYSFVLSVIRCRSVSYQKYGGNGCNRDGRTEPSSLRFHVLLETRNPVESRLASLTSPIVL